MELILNGENTEYIVVKDFRPTIFGDEELQVKLQWEGGNLIGIDIRTPYGDHNYVIEDTGFIRLTYAKVYHKTSLKEAE